MLLRSLRKDRLTPGNLSAIEKLRWANVLRLKVLYLNSWKRLFNMVPVEKHFHGIRKRWVTDHYEHIPLCFNCDGTGIGSNHIRNDQDTGKLFVRCLPERQLALYVNSPIQSVVDTVKGRLRGDSDCSPIPYRQDLVDMYFRFEYKSSRIYKSIGYCEMIILDHFGDILDKIDRKERYNDPLLTLSINGRVYVCKGRELIIKPEKNIWIFTESDLTDTTEGIDYADRYQLSIIPKEQ